MAYTPLSPVSLHLLYYRLEVAPTALICSEFKLFSLLPTLFQQFHVAKYTVIANVSSWTI
jgi:hypothetical protein